MCDTVNTTTVVVLFMTFVYDIDIYYKTWIYQCLIKQVKSPSSVSRLGTWFGSVNRVRPGWYQSLGLGVSGKSLRLLMYLHRMCWPNADVFVLFIV